MDEGRCPKGGKEILMTRKFQIGDRVRAKVHLDEGPSDDGLGVSRCASFGDVLFIRGICESCENSFRVSHENVLDRSFWVADNEVEAY